MGVGQAHTAVKEWREDMSPSNAHVPMTGRLAGLREVGGHFTPWPHIGLEKGRPPDSLCLASAVFKITTSCLCSPRHMPAHLTVTSCLQHRKTTASPCHTPSVSHWDGSNTFLTVHWLPPPFLSSLSPSPRQVSSLGTWLRCDIPNPY